MRKDYYSILGISKDANKKEIKNAYRNLSKKYHPDKPDGDEDKFKEISEAYSVLSDDQKRKEYDNPNPFGGGFGFRRRGGSSSGFSDFNFEDLFRQFEKDFSGWDAAGREGWNTGRDEGYDDRHRSAADWDSFQDDFNSGRRSKRTTRSAFHEPDERTIQINWAESLTGTKVTVSVDRNNTVSIKVPKGVNPGWSVVKKGQGKQIFPGGPRLDLIVTIDVEDHPYFTRNGLDVYVDKDINVLDLIVGSTIEVRNPYNKAISVKIPAESKIGSKLRLKGQGIESETESGDLYVTLNAVIPTGLSEKQKHHVRQARNDI